MNWLSKLLISFKIDDIIRSGSTLYLVRGIDFSSKKYYLILIADISESRIFNYKINDEMFIPIATVDKFFTKIGNLNG